MKSLVLPAFDVPAALRDLDGPVDNAIVAGYLKSMAEHRFPVTLGRDFAGAAERIVVPADGFVAALPEGVGMAAAAAASLTGVTALLLVEGVAPSAGGRVAVVGASGGVGAFAVQLAAGARATVIAVSAPEDEDFVLWRSRRPTTWSASPASCPTCVCRSSAPTISRMPEPPSQSSPGATPEASAPSVSPDDLRQIDGVLDALREALGNDLLAVYLYGSAVLGGLRPESDLDLLAVSRRRLDDAERPPLLTRVRAASGVRSTARPGRPIELSVAVHDDLRPWRHPADRDLLYGEWLRRDLEAGDLSPFRHQSSPDLTTLIAIVLMAGVPLLGPPPQVLLDPIPAADLAEAVTEGVDDLLANLEPDTRNVLLTLARVWYTVETGAIRPKDEAAGWAAARLPADEREVLELAAAAYRGEVQDDWDARTADAAAAAAAMTAQIRLTSG